MLFVLMPYVSIPGIGKTVLSWNFENYDNTKLISSDSIHHDVWMEARREHQFLNEDARKEWIAT